MGFFPDLSSHERRLNLISIIQLILALHISKQLIMLFCNTSNITENTEVFLCFSLVLLSFWFEFLTTPLLLKKPNIKPLLKNLKLKSIRVTLTALKTSLMGLISKTTKIHTIKANYRKSMIQPFLYYYLALNSLSCEYYKSSCFWGLI
jgi:hypothetical protein